jgi:outer membrane immunogenic protein
MKKLIVTALAATVIRVTPAFAADIMPAKAPIYVPADPWSGFYGGGSLGARRSDVDWRTLDFDDILDIFPASNIDNPAHLNATSFRVGAYAGYNWLFAPAALVGLEGDIAWGNNNKTRGGFPGTVETNPTLDLITAKLGWDASIRARLGYLITPNWLAYATGGIAWQEIHTLSICTANPNISASPASFCTGGTGTSTSGLTSTTKTGWTAGGGIETILAAHWIGRVEYRYADFGHVANRFPPAPLGGFHAEVDVKTQTALVGVAYKF